MLHRLANAVQIVNPNVADVGAGQPDVGENQWHFPQLQVFEQHLFHAEGHNGNPFHAAFDHPPHGSFHALGVVTRGGQKNLVVVLDGNSFEDLDDLRKEWIGDLGNDESKDTTPSGDQGPRLSIGIVAKFLDYIPDTLGQLWIDSRAVSYTHLTLPTNRK